MSEVQETELLNKFLFKILSTTPAMNFYVVKLSPLPLQADYTISGKNKKSAVAECALTFVTLGLMNSKTLTLM